MGQFTEVFAKTGGSIVTDAERIIQTARVIKELGISGVAISAPADDGKHGRMTSVLKSIAQRATQKEKDRSWEADWKSKVSDRLLGLELEGVNNGVLLGLLNEKFELIKKGKLSFDEIVALGEFFMAQIMAWHLEYEFLDPMDCIYLDENLNVTRESYQIIRDKVADKKVVIPGFYGNYNDKITLLPGGGSDIMGAIMAIALGREFIRFTEEPICAFDPELGKGAALLTEATFREAGQMTRLNDHIIHAKALRLLEKHEIPTEIRSIDTPKEGLKLVYKRHTNGQDVLAISCRNDLVSIQITKWDLVDEKARFNSNLYTTLEKYNLSDVLVFPTDTSVTLLIPESDFDNSLFDEDHILNKLRDVTNADNVTPTHGWSIIGLIGEGMRDKPGVTSRYYSVLSQEGISVPADQSPPKLGVMFLAFDNRAIFKKAFDVLRKEAFKK